VQTFENIDIQEIPLSSPIFRRKVEAFLAANGLRFEEVDSYYVLLDGEGEIVAGAGLHNDVIKCVAVDSHARSGGLMVPLVSHVINHAAARGITNLKVFTKPENESIFVSLGFHLIARAPKAILMENGRGLEEYIHSLRTFASAVGKSAGERLPVQGAERSETEDLPPAGVIVMNANPFTLGHQYLVRKAAEAVEHLFVIPVRADGNIFPYEERLAMIKAGCGSLATVLEGSEYQISDITFPTYFLKDLSDASETQIRLDLDLFGRHIAPALGARVRFIGSEPLDPLTARYNELMKDILPAYGILVVEIPRLSVPSFSPVPEVAFSPVPELVEGPVSATNVRQALADGSFITAAALTPPTTWPYLVAELMARALKLELDTPLKPGLVDRNSNGAHSDMDYDLMLGSIKVIRRSFAKRLVETLSLARDLESSDNQGDDKSLVANTKGWTLSNLLINNKLQITDKEALSSIGRAVEADVLEYTNGVNTHRGAIFALGLASISVLELSRDLQLADNQQNKQTCIAQLNGATIGNSLNNNQLQITPLIDAGSLSDKVAELAGLIVATKDSHGGRAVSEYAVKGALQMAQDGYSPLFEDWLPYYRSLVQPMARLAHQPDKLAHQPDTLAYKQDERLQKTLLRIMSQLDDTCVIHRVGYARAQEIKEEAKALLADFSEEGLKEMKERYDAEGISPGGAADMLALTILVDSLLK
jgi:cytidyltransferase-like protein